MKYGKCVLVLLFLLGTIANVRADRFLPLPLGTGSHSGASHSFSTNRIQMPLGTGSHFSASHQFSTNRVQMPLGTGSHFSTSQQFSTNRPFIDSRRFNSVHHFDHRFHAFNQFHHRRHEHHHSEVFFFEEPLIVFEDDFIEPSDVPLGWSGDPDLGSTILYYCADPAGYYPAVMDCPAGWQTFVVAAPR